MYFEYSLEYWEADHSHAWRQDQSHPEQQHDHLQVLVVDIAEAFDTVVELYTLEQVVAARGSNEQINDNICLRK